MTVAEMNWHAKGLMVASHSHYVSRAAQMRRAPENEVPRNAQSPAT
jgi:hypothetical protein